MKKEKIMSTESMSVLIPYSDLEKLVNTVQNYEKDRKELETLKGRMSALQKIYGEVLERLDEIYNSL